MVEVHEYRPDYAVPPGWVLEERLEAQGISQAEFAQRCGCSPKLISEIISGKASLEPATASQFERVLGVDASLWLGIEADYRRQLKKKYTLSWLKVLIDRFLQWFQQAANHLRPPVLVPVGVGVLVCIIVYSSGFVGNSDQEERQGFVAGNDKESNDFRKAASVGEVQVSNKTGSVIGKDATDFQNLQLLAEQGQAKAQFFLGEMYYQGKDVSKDYVDAYMWWSLAAGQGLDEASEKREMVAQQMTSGQITEAERRACEWKIVWDDPKQ